MFFNPKQEEQKKCGMNIVEHSVILVNPESLENTASIRNMMQSDLLHIGTIKNFTYLSFNAQ